MIPKDNGHLLTHAESILNPEVFSHPVWLRFGLSQVDTVHKIIEDLFSISSSLEKDDPGSACQFLFVCVAYQNLAKQHDSALNTLQRIQTLAEQNTLENVIICAKWGMSSTSFQAGQFEQAGRYLGELQEMLVKKKEWILANYIDVIRESLGSSQMHTFGKAQNRSDDPSFNGLWSITVHWLDHWGEPDHKTPSGISPGHPPTEKAQTSINISQFLLSTRRWQDYWQRLVMVFKTSVIGNRAKPDNGPRTTIHIIDDPPGEQNFVNEDAPKLEPEHRNRVVSSYTSSSNSVIAQMLGSFNMAIQDRPIKLPASRGLSVLKYLMVHHKHSIPRDVLMDVFWPDSEPDSARNNLNVALHSLRQTMRSITENPIIYFENGAYCLAPNLELWLDVEEFEHCVKEGQRVESRGRLSAAVIEYEIAVNLYRGDFLADNPYENWTIVDRERLRVAYLDTLDRLSQIYLKLERYTACVSLCQIILTRDSCREDIHCRLMLCFSRLGQTALALRQYQICAEALHEELEVEPAPATTKLYEYIRRREQV